MDIKTRLQLLKIQLVGQRAEIRARRMQTFLNLVKPPAGAKIIDLGGTPFLWSLLDGLNFDVTLVNLPSEERAADVPPEFRMIYADACELQQLFPDKYFDVVFSNSVIEHVGDRDRQHAFAQEVLRLADAYWVQTPCPSFPIEAHTGTPFYWQRSERARQRLIENWEKTLPAWSEMVRGTRAISQQELQELLPHSSLYIERFMGLPKSCTVYRPFQTQESTLGQRSQASQLVS